MLVVIKDNFQENIHTFEVIWMLLIKYITTKDKQYRVSHYIYIHTHLYTLKKIMI